MLSQREYVSEFLVALANTNPRHPALRLYPTLPMNIRFANKATVLPRGGGSDGTSPVLLPEGLALLTLFIISTETNQSMGQMPGFIVPRDGKAVSS